MYIYCGGLLRPQKDSEGTLTGLFDTASDFFEPFRSAGRYAAEFAVRQIVVRTRYWGTPEHKLPAPETVYVQVSTRNAVHTMLRAVRERPDEENEYERVVAFRGDGYPVLHAHDLATVRVTHPRDVMVDQIYVEGVLRVGA